MGDKGSATRERILAAAETLMLNKGYSGTSIEDILARAHITKGGFFYHFDGKNDLAVGLLQRYRRNDRAFFEDLGNRARELVEDPLQQMLLFLKLLAEAMADLPSVHPGCLVASFTYECEQVNEEVKAINREVILEWRDMFKAQLALIDDLYDKRTQESPDALADMLTGIIEGGIVMSKALDQQTVLVEQILQYRNYLKLLYGVV